MAKYKDVYGPSDRIPSWQLDISKVADTNWIIEKTEYGASIFMNLSKDRSERREEYDSVKSMLTAKDNIEKVSLAVLAFGVYLHEESSAVQSDIDDVVENFADLYRDELGGDDRSVKSRAANVGSLVRKKISEIGGFGRQYVSAGDDNESVNRIINGVRSIVSSSDDDILTLALMAIALNANGNRSSAQKYSDYVVWKHDDGGRGGMQNEAVAIRARIVELAGNKRAKRGEP